jgi:ketosteroid isomerase-like protein
MSQENVEIVRAYYSAWNAGGLDAARKFWSHDFEWQDAPEMPDAGSYKGVEAAAAHFEDLNEVLGTMKVEVDRLLPVGDEVFVSLRVHLDAPRGGLPIDGVIHETIRVEDGKIVRIRLFLDEHEALEAAGLRE